MENTAEQKVELVTTLPVKAREYVLAINQLKEQYGKLELKDVTDKKQYEVIRDARIDVKKVRIGIEKFCKAERDAANAYIKANTTKEKEILSLISPLENYLTQEEKKWEDEQKRLADIEKRKAEEKAMERTKQIIAVGFQYDGYQYRLENMNVGRVEIEGYTDEQWANLVSGGQIIQNRIKAEAEERERIAREEAERIAKEREEMEAERQRLKAIADEQEARAAELARKEAEQAEKERLEAKAIQDEADRIEREKREAIAKEQREAELEKARKEAAEQARKDEADRIERERLAKIEADRIAAEKEAAKLAKAPDKKKLELYAMKIVTSQEVVDLKSKEAKEICTKFNNKIIEALNWLKTETEKL